MGRETGIAWCDHTYNPWSGCSKVSPGCKFCYAETLSKRFGDDIWGLKADRKTFKDKHWNEPLKWDRSAEKDGVRRKVFCGSMCDVFEDHEKVTFERWKLWSLIIATPNLDWLLLTKRPENIVKLIKTDANSIGQDAFYSSNKEAGTASVWLSNWAEGKVPENVWLGTSTENQEYAEKRIPILSAAPAKIRFLSAEPLIGAIDLLSVIKPAKGHSYPTNPTGKSECANGCGCGFSVYQDWGPAGIDPYGECPNAHPAIDWVIFGGESGAGARPMELEWVKQGIEQCKELSIAPFVKQMGAQLAKEMGLNHTKGEDPEEWPEEIQIREFPV